MNYEVMSKQLNDYFDNVSEEQFLIDVENAGCSHMIEEVSPDILSQGSK